MKPNPTGSLRTRRGLSLGEERWMRALDTALVRLDLPSELSSLVREIALLAPSNYRAGVAAIAASTLVHARGGHTRCPLDGIIPMAEWMDRAESAGAMSQLEALVESPELGAPVLGGPESPIAVKNGLYGLRRFAELERVLAEQLDRLSKADTSVAVSLDSVTFESLSEEQKSAIHAAAESSISVLSGGPGTGKTSVVVALLEAFETSGCPSEHIVLTAPTGKAVNRMEASIRSRRTEDLPKAETVHRLLGARPGRARMAFGLEQPLPYRVIIVDEASMLGLGLATALLLAAPTGAKLVFLGDVDQLPSVEAGSVLASLVDVKTPKVSVSRLTHSFRMNADDAKGASILQLSKAILQRNAALAERILREQLEVSWLETESEMDRWLLAQFRASYILDAQFRREALSVHSMVDEHFEHPARVDALIARTQSTQLLVMNRQYSFRHGSERVNELLHRWYRETLGALDEESLLPGEPIMMTHNDYGRGLFNGDTGLVVKVASRRSGARLSEAARPMAVFPSSRGPRAFELPPLEGALELAHATTVHKAQGSEYNRVSILLAADAKEASSISPAMLYTAVTRAKQGLSLASSKAVFRNALALRSKGEQGKQLLRALGEK